MLPRGFPVAARPVTGHSYGRPLEVPHRMAKRMSAELQSASPRDVALEGEHPDRILADMEKRARGNAHVIVVANEKGGVGKSTIAFHLVIGLLHAGHRVAAIDLDRRQQTLSRVLAYRDGTICRLRAKLPSPRHATLQVQSGATLCHEMMRLGSDCDVIVIDVAGHDSAIARRAIAVADTLVTPVNNSFADLDLLARFSPVSGEIVGPGCFATVVEEIRNARLNRGLGEFDWVVVGNRIRRETSRNQQSIAAALERIAPKAGFRKAAGLSERTAYRELFLLGLTHLDLKAMSELPAPNPHVLREIQSLVASVQAGVSASCPVAA